MKTSSQRIPTLKRKLWKVFAQYVKIRDNHVCYTCGAIVYGSNANAGHFIPKGAGGLALYFHPDNVHCQCVYCNLVMEGNHYIYGRKLGESKVKELYSLKGTVVKNYPFDEQIAFYTEWLPKNS